MKVTNGAIKYTHFFNIFLKSQLFLFRPLKSAFETWQLIRKIKGEDKLHSSTKSFLNSLARSLLPRWSLFYLRMLINNIFIFSRFSSSLLTLSMHTILLSNSCLRYLCSFHRDICRTRTPGLKIVLSDDNWSDEIQTGNHFC